jgi:hypothetical protein
VRLITFRRGTQAAPQFKQRRLINGEEEKMEDEKDARNLPPESHFKANSPDGLRLGDSKITAEDALLTLSRRNNKRLPPLPKCLANLPPVNIFNVFSERWIVPKGGLGIFTVQPCADGMMHSPALVIPHIVVEAIPINQSQMEYRFYDGREVANDIVNPATDAPNAISRWGVFVASGQLPTGKEIEQARWKLYQTCLKFAVEATELIEATESLPDPDRIGARRNIGPMHHKALRYVQNYRPEWQKL